jgi:hypothetical protein
VLASHDRGFVFVARLDFDAANECVHSASFDIQLILSHRLHGRHPLTPAQPSVLPAVLHGHVSEGHVQQVSPDMARKGVSF